ncbi:translation initiation factor IF-2-like [Ursus maritimus]|uniref:Translation initiation factor IF-2-like n=1 Tax=Ursus maritimus TaxID=29073 RepID=A0A8M1G470_URSMA|nr:translation initiation factor IF-2-like [Ursus maritimus]
MDKDTEEYPRQVPRRTGAARNAVTVYDRDALQKLQAAPGSERPSPSTGRPHDTLPEACAQLWSVVRTIWGRPRIPSARGRAAGATGAPRSREWKTAEGNRPQSALRPSPPPPPAAGEVRGSRGRGVARSGGFRRTTRRRGGPGGRQQPRIVVGLAEHSHLASGVRPGPAPPPAGKVARGRAGPPRSPGGPRPRGRPRSAAASAPPAPLPAARGAPSPHPIPPPPPPAGRAFTGRARAAAPPPPPLGAPTPGSRRGMTWARGEGLGGVRRAGRGSRNGGARAAGRAAGRPSRQETAALRHVFCVSAAAPPSLANASAASSSPSSSRRRRGVSFPVRPPPRDRAPLAARRGAGPRRCGDGPAAPPGLARKLFGPEMEVRSEFPSPRGGGGGGGSPPFLAASAQQQPPPRRRAALPPPRAPGSSFFGEIPPAAPSRDPRPSPRPARAP